MTYQKSAIFGFGEKAETQKETVLKISSLSNKEINVMDKNKVQVHNKEEERSVGFFNHDISICGKLNADSVSTKMVFNTSHNIMGSSRSFRTFSWPANQMS